MPELSIVCIVTPDPITPANSLTSSPLLNLVVFADPTLIEVVPALTLLPVVVNPAVNTVL